MPPHRNALLLAGILPLCIVPVWAAGGTYRAWQGPFLPLCALAWLLFLLMPAGADLPPRSARLRGLLRDPAFWAALLLLLLLATQAWNSPRTSVPDLESGTGLWTYSPAPHPRLPWSFNPSEAEEMVRWFAPVITVFLLVRHCGTALPRQALLFGICLNGLANAALSFTHLRLGWEKMYNFETFGKDVYGSFGYPNHGAIYFVLLTALSLGLCLNELFRERAERDNGMLGFGALCTPVFFLAASLSTSRAGILGAWLLVLLVFLTHARLAWPRMHPVQRMVGFVATATVFAALGSGFYFFAKPIHLRELANATVNLDIAREVSSRWFQVESAWRMWLDHPWFGVGGWGYRYLAAEYLPVSQWHLLEGWGKANVHNDLMQFLVEFGLVGIACLLVIFGPALLQALRGIGRPPTEDDSLWASPLRISAFWGIAILFLVNLFDIPLRSPAVFVHGIVLLSLLPPLPSDNSVWLPIVDWKLLQPPAFRILGRRKSEPDAEEYTTPE